MAQKINIQASPTEVIQNELLVLKIRLAIATGYDEVLPEINNLITYYNYDKKRK